METLPDYLGEGLAVVSIGLNPSVRSVADGYYFAHPRNRFWRALNRSALVPEPVEPGPDGVRTLFERHAIGFTDVVKRPTRGGGELRAADFREWAPVLRDKLLGAAPRLAWFHGKQAYTRYLRYAENERPEGVPWGEQPRPIGAARVYVTPNPSPANAAFSLDELTAWYDRLAAMLRETG